MTTPDNETLIETLARDLRPVKPASFARVYGTGLFLGLGVLVLAWVISGVRADWAERVAETDYWLVVAGVTAGFFLSLVGTFSLAFPARAETPARHLVWSGLAPFAFGLRHLYVAYGAGASPTVFTSGDAACGALLLGVAALPALFFSTRIAGLAPFRCASAAFGAGLAAFSAGSVFLLFHCANGNAYHAAVWHFLPVVPAAALFALCARGFVRSWQNHPSPL